MKKNILFLICLIVLGNSLQAQMAITAIVPNNASVGSRITLQGNNFSTNASDFKVFFGDVATVVNSATSSALTVTVPNGAAYKPITVVNTATQTVAVSTSFFTPVFNQGKSQALSSASFSSKTNFTVGAVASAMPLSLDADDDGKPDIINVNKLTNTFSVLKNNTSNKTITTNSFATKVDFLTDSTPSSIAWGDLNADGKPDLVVANKYFNSITIYQNNASNGVINSSSFLAPIYLQADSFSLPTAIAVDDVDNDGKPDIVVSSSFLNCVSILKNISTSAILSANSFALPMHFKTGLAPNSVCIADIDGDGKKEIITANLNGKNISILQNNIQNMVLDTSSFSSKIDIATKTCPIALAVADFDADGKMDIVVANQTSNNIEILKSNATVGSISTSSFAAPIYIATNAELLNHVSVSCLDGSKYPSIITTSTIDKSVSIFQNKFQQGQTFDSSAFNAPIKLTTGNFPTGATAADVDGDGKPDILVTQSGDNSVAIYKNLLPDILPLNEINLIGFKQDKVNQLQWTVAEPSLYTSFNILKSSNGDRYSKLGKINLTNDVNKYTFIDSNQTTNTAYYVIEATTQDGKAVHSNVICLKQSSVIPNIAIYPNPCTNSFSIKNNKEMKQIMLYDVAGKLVKVFAINSNNQYSVSELKSGTYTVILHGQAQNAEAIVLIKQ